MQTLRQSVEDRPRDDPAQVDDLLYINEVVLNLMYKVQY